TICGIAVHEAQHRPSNRRGYVIHPALKGFQQPARPDIKRGSRYRRTRLRRPGSRDFGQGKRLTRHRRLSTFTRTDVVVKGIGLRQGVQDQSADTWQQNCRQRWQAWRYRQRARDDKKPMTLEESASLARSEEVSEVTCSGETSPLRGSVTRSAR